MQFTDQMNRKVQVNFPPKRIVSLVPSQTEFLWDLGLHKEVVGVTKFCIHPQEALNTAAQIGGTKKLDFEKIESLKPDLIIGNKEENNKEDIEHLQEKFPVWMSDINTLEDAYRMMHKVGEITNRMTEAAKIILDIKRNAQAFTPSADKKTVAYFIWKKPFMVAGKNNFIDHMLDKCGLANVFSSPVNESRYPETSIEELQILRPDLIFLSTEPYPFSEKHIDEFQKICPEAKVCLVDGEMFSWYGSRLLKAFPYFTSLMKGFN